MPDPLRPLRINALELLRQPGATRHVEATVAATDLEVEHEALAGDVTVDVDLHVLNDGIEVTGTVSAPWTAPCRRCLTDLAGEAVATVDELYQRLDDADPGHVTDDDAYPIENNQLDLAPMARQSVLLELDTERLCRVDCAGLCPQCGADLNVTSCDCDTTVVDERWAALADLDLDD